MKKILMLACCAFLMASCGSGSDYLDGAKAANEKAIDAIEKAESEEDIEMAELKLATDVLDLTNKYKEELEKVVEDKKEQKKYEEFFDQLDKDLEKAKKEAKKRIK